MRFKYFFYLTVYILLVVGACSPKTISTKGEASYSEDLRPYHLNYEDSLKSLGLDSNGETDENVVPNPEKKQIYANIETKYAITDSINNFLDKVAAHNRQTNEYQGVTIQVYSGFDREKANAAKNKVYDVLPDSEPRLVYEQPNYKVRVGKFTSRLEAQKAYAALKDAFPLVLIVPEKFKVVE